MTQIPLPATAPNPPVPHNEATCPFCSKKFPPGVPNKLTNNSTTLGSNSEDGDVLGLKKPVFGRNTTFVPNDAPQWAVLYIHPKTKKEEATEVRSNPHHCIPGEASLAGHPILEWIKEGTITGDIGYDVNHKKNGIWLPTIAEDFYAGYKDEHGNKLTPTAEIKWGKLSTKYPTEQFTMAEAAMLDAKRQFHDAHPDYSKQVKLDLKDVMKELVIHGCICPEAQNKEKEKVPPPFGLIGELNYLSKFLAKKLKGDPDTWSHPYVTSRHALKLSSDWKKILQGN